MREFQKDAFSVFGGELLEAAPDESVRTLIPRKGEEIETK